MQIFSFLWVNNIEIVQAARSIPVTCTRKSRTLSHNFLRLILDVLNVTFCMLFIRCSKSFEFLTVNSKQKQKLEDSTTQKKLNFRVGFWAFQGQDVRLNAGRCQADGQAAVLLPGKPRFYNTAGPNRQITLWELCNAKRERRDSSKLSKLSLKISSLFRQITTCLLNCSHAEVFVEQILTYLLSR